MSEPVAPLSGARFAGAATVEAQPPQGMVTLRGDLSAPGIAGAVRAAVSLGVPGPRAILTGGDRAVAWMSPDELLLMMPYGAVPEALAAMTQALAGTHALAVDVSDARAVFDLSGAGSREALAKLAPVDLSPAAFGPGEIRRTRLAQTSAAFWMTGGDRFRVVCFRSVAQYVFDILSLSAHPAAAVGVFRA